GHAQDMGLGQALERERQGCVPRHEARGARDARRRRRLDRQYLVDLGLRRPGPHPHGLQRLEGRRTHHDQVGGRAVRAARDPRQLRSPRHPAADAHVEGVGRSRVAREIAARGAAQARRPGGRGRARRAVPGLGRGLVHHGHRAAGGRRLPGGMRERSRPAMAEAEFDRAKAKAFTQLMVRHLEGAAVSVMLDVGRRVGLFEAMAKMSAATSVQIAEKTGLSERYVREWLGAMVCGGIVEYAAGERTYRLPREHAAALTGGSTRNLSSMVEMFPLMNRVIPDVAEAFRTGGGVPYSAFQPDFTGLMDRRSRPRYDELLFSYLAKPEGIAARLEAGIRVADVGCGTGHCVGLMARRFPKSTFVGYDISEAGIAGARAAAAGLANASFEVQDVAKLEASTPFDLVTAFDAIHDQADPAGVLRRIRGALATGGTFL